MGFFEEVVLTHSIQIRTTPEQIFAFLTGITDDESYRAWHQQDHVHFRWIKGPPWAKGSILCAEEFIHGKRHKLKFKITQITPNERIEYTPVFPLTRKFFPRNEFVIQQKGEYCRFIAAGTYRLGWIGKTFFKKAIEKGLSSVKQHMKEEGENLKKILEST